MNAFASVNDVQAMWRTLTAAEQTKAAAVLPVISDQLRQYAANRGKNLDEMIMDGVVYESVVKSVVVDVFRRYMASIGDESAPMSQMSQSALGYTVSGTYLVPGGGFFIKNNELAKLGLRRQQIGGVNLVGTTRNRCDALDADTEWR